MQDRRAFLSRSLAFAAALPAAAAFAGALPAAAAAAAGRPSPLPPPDLPPSPPAAIAALDVRPLGNGLFLVSGWVLTAADLGALGHAA